MNKMHVMEDVHEGCNAQPSSPGHAEQRQDILEMCNEGDLCTKEDLQPENENELKVTEIKSENSDENKIIVKIETTESSSPVCEALPNAETEANHVNDDSISSDSTGENNVLKRKLDSDASTESPPKRLHTQIQKSFQGRDDILCKYMESIGCNTLEQIQSNTEQIMTEIRKLNEDAKQKEKEWNNILYLKKMKEELLIRLQRQKQLILLNNDDFESEYVFSNDDRYQNINNNLQKPKHNNAKAEMRNPNYFQERHTLSTRQKSFNGKNIVYNHYDMNGQNDYRQNKSRPTLDVKSLIADYRQKHPEAVPRRGRRIRTALSQCEAKISAGGVLNLSNVALGSGAQVRQNPSGTDMSKELGLVINSNDELRKDNVLNVEPSPHTDSTSFKDMLAQFAKLSQAERQEILHNAVKPPPPYPEVTVHPVPTTSTSNSLLHGILTKSQNKAESKSTFSPTLARLLTAPEKSNLQSSSNHGNGVATITDILCNSKARHEITITPVGQYDTPMKGKTSEMEEDETEDSVDRLVIDEGGEVVDGRSKDNNSDIGDEVPQCQGCNQKPAQFVCAGCANQWYCSRDCQVSAWDEHSEVCSG
ncbi:hypothetical protein AMK59_8213 [Oryctes borbonicus]|uniref:MYND-type domain-containing protein n=1 Tax=Oryctes borbonicus TaxID=1629725 RepID=A0A0T6AYU7_9SCAR|nr:hypothetical protein AMK59_8213 [Oryctes borbonicus]